LRAIWILIDDQESGFGQTVLKKTSILKAEKLAVIHASVFQRKWGKLPADFGVRVQTALKKALLLV